MIVELGTTPVVPQIRKWLRGVDLNHRPLGYENNRLQLNHLNLKHGRDDSGSQKHRQFNSVTADYERI